MLPLVEKSHLILIHIETIKYMLNTGPTFLVNVLHIYS